MNGLSPQETARLCIALFHCGMFAIGAHFGIIVFEGGSPVTPELYGPAVYEIPALVWAAGQVGSHGLIILGLAIWGRIGMGAVMAGGVLAAVFHSFLAYFGSLASQGTLVHAASIYLTAPASMLTVAFAGGAWWVGRK